MSTEPHPPAKSPGFNASAWALTHKSFVGFMMVVLLLRGTRLDGTRPDHDTDRDDGTGKDQP